MAGRARRDRRIGARTIVSKNDRASSSLTSSTAPAERVAGVVDQSEEAQIGEHVLALRAVVDVEEHGLDVDTGVVGGRLDDLGLGIGSDRADRAKAPPRQLDRGVGRSPSWRRS